MGRDLTKISENGELPEPLNPDDPDQYRPEAHMTPMQIRFCHEYLVDFNGKAAAIRAGYSERSAHVKASNLINEYNVSYLIGRLLRERNERTGVESDQVVRELSYLCFSDISNYTIDEEGFVDLAPEARSEAMRAVKSIKRRVKLMPNGPDEEPTKVIETEIVLYDKNVSLGLLGRHLGMYVNKHELTGKDGGPIQHVQTWKIAGRDIVF